MVAIKKYLAAFPALVSQLASTCDTTKIPHRCSLKLRWKCSVGHEWEATVANRVGRNGKGSGCPFCCGKRASDSNCVAVNELLAREWCQELNGDLKPTDLTLHSGKKVWWQCLAGHRWSAQPNRRSGGSGCPFCAHVATDFERSLAKTHPKEAAEWHPKNTLVVSGVRAGSGKMAWWLCSQGHQWEQRIYDRIRGPGCPRCNLLANSLAATFPEVATQWHPTKNDEKPTEILPRSNKKAWWLCSCGHEWFAYIYSRTSQALCGCPSCAYNHTDLERHAEILLGLPKFNRSPLEKSETKYRPDLQCADTIFVNVDGLYWHCELNRDRHYHQELRLAFEAEGLRILQFYEDEIHGKPQVVRSIVGAVIGKSESYLGARQCELRTPCLQEAQVFLDANHLMGANIRSQHLGLYFWGKLVHVLSYRIHADHLEIVRSAGLLDTVVRGAFQRLLKALRAVAPRLPVRTLVDLRYADGHSLEKAGFRMVKEYIQYQYTDGKTRKDKRTFRVKAGIDEVQAAAAQGWYRIWDAGRRSYELAP